MNAYRHRGFIYTSAPFPQCHASTIAQTERGLVAAWFGGKEEGAGDVRIWLSRQDGRPGVWSEPRPVGDGGGTPCWNPVLFAPRRGPLLLFYKVGPSPRTWWGMLARSDDGGETFAPAERLPEGFLGPIKNKPIALPDGGLLCPSSTESEMQRSVWRVHFERADEAVKKWSMSEPPIEESHPGAIQPTILTLRGGELLALVRTRAGKVHATRSRDGGRSWSALEPTELPNPNAGIDAVTLRDGRQLLVYNPVASGRTPLSVAISADGVRWENRLALEDAPGEYSYPAVIQSRDGLVQITYTWRRERIRHIILDPKAL